jgi:hypothetical protein
MREKRNLKIGVACDRHGREKNLKIGVACDRHEREKKFEDWCGV